MAKQVRSNRGPKNKQQKNHPNRSNNSTKLKSNPKFKKRPTNNKATIKRKLQGRVQDARQKIIQKKRNVTDARDVLTKMAKTQDARSKLDRMRSSRTTKPNSRANLNVKVIGSNILQKVDRNGKISLVTTNKSRNPSEMNIAIQKQLGLIAPSRPQLKRTPPKKPFNPKVASPVRRTIVNEINYALPAVERLEPRSYEGSLYKWIKPDLRPASHLIGSLDTTRQTMRDVVREELMLANRAWDLIPPKPMRVQPHGYIDLDAVNEDEEMPLVNTGISRIALRGSTRVSNVHSRLDSAPIQPRSHGILAQGTKTKVVVPAGHRIVVSNLESNVTEDDIKELFEDVGQLLSAKLARPGVAEVIFKNLKDAQKAVDTYHNRQLDGQPMKCLLVNKRPLHQPTGLPLPKSEGAVTSTNSSPSAVLSNKLVPDLSTIHKVLFQRK